MEGSCVGWRTGEVRGRERNRKERELRVRGMEERMEEWKWSRKKQR